MSLKELALIAAIAEPLLLEILAYVRGGPKPTWFSKLPEKCRTSVEYDALKARKLAGH